MEEGTGGEFPDWEVLYNAEAKTSESLEVIGADTDSERIICSNYFSLDNQGKYVGEEGDVSEDGSVGSDNPSWIDPRFDDRHGSRNSVEFLSDSGSNRSEERKVSDVDAGTGLGAAEIIKSQAGFEEITGERENLLEFDYGDCKGRDLDGKGELDIEELDELRTLDKDLGTLWASAKLGDLAKDPEIRSDDFENRRATEKGDDSTEEEGEGKPVVEEEKKKVEWWKAPLEVLKFCVFRVSPVWSFSLAAAVMGFLILGRRLYKLKQKTQSLHLNVTVDDEKVSQFMILVAKRAPMVRPSLPAPSPGVTVNVSPAMSMMRW